MICPKCKELGIKSKVRFQSSRNTIFDNNIGYWDENGDWINFFNLNLYETFFYCSNGHRFKQETHLGKTETIILDDCDKQEEPL